MNSSRFIHIRRALDDFLEEKQIEIQDILSVMDEEVKGIERYLREKTLLREEEIEKLVRKYSSRELNLLIFVLQTFYIVNMGGLYKGRLILPLRGEILQGNKATLEGISKLLRALGIFRI